MSTIQENARPALTVLSEDEIAFRGAVAEFARGEVAPRVQQMERDAKIQRGTRPFIFCDLKREHNLDQVVAWVEREVLFGKRGDA